MKIGEFRELDIPSLHLQLDQLRKELFELRVQAVTEKLENPHQLGNKRREIARVLTVLGERGEQDIEEKQIHLKAAKKLAGASQ